MPPQNRTSHWITAMPPRVSRSRASCSWRTISPAAIGTLVDATRAA
jgi:hypothetical protein